MKLAQKAAAAEDARWLPLNRAPDEPGWFAQETTTVRFGAVQRLWLKLPRHLWPRPPEEHEIEREIEIAARGEQWGTWG